MTDTEILFKNFHKKNKEEVGIRIDTFLKECFFPDFPNLRKLVSVLLIGSVAHGYHDTSSDIDIAFIFSTDTAVKQHKLSLLKWFKYRNLESRRKPLELHGQHITSLETLEKELSSWRKDWLLRELHDAVVVYDPGEKVGKLQKKYSWYPRPIYNEKINWLFAETTFLLFQRYTSGLARKNDFYLTHIKHNILTLLMLAVILVNHKFPSSHKHLYNDVRNSKIAPKDFLTAVGALLELRDRGKIYTMLQYLRKDVEILLISRKLIKKESPSYWIGQRPKYKVSIDD